MSLFDAYKPLIEMEAGQAIYKGLRKLRRKIEDEDE